MFPNVEIMCIITYTIIIIIIIIIMIINTVDLLNERKKNTALKFLERAFKQRKLPFCGIAKLMFAA